MLRAEGSGTTTASNIVAESSNAPTKAKAPDAKPEVLKALLRISLGLTRPFFLTMLTNWCGKSLSTTYLYKTGSKGSIGIPKLSSTVKASAILL